MHTKSAINDSKAIINSLTLTLGMELDYSNLGDFVLPEDKADRLFLYAIKVLGSEFNITTLQRLDRRITRLLTCVADKKYANEYYDKKVEALEALEGMDTLSNDEVVHLLTKNVIILYEIGPKFLATVLAKTTLSLIGEELL